MAKLQWQDCVGRKKIGRSIDDNKFFISRGCIIEHVGVRGTCVLRDWTATRRRRKRMGKEKHQCGIFWFSLGTFSTAIFLFPLSLSFFFSRLSPGVCFDEECTRDRGAAFFMSHERERRNEDRIIERRVISEQREKTLTQKLMNATSFRGPIRSISD